MDDRRTHTRYPIWFPLVVEVGEKSVWAICRDAGGGGVLVSAVAPIDVDASVRLKFRLTVGEPDRVKDAKVVRLIDNEDELLLAFPYRVALEFAERDEAFPAELSKRCDDADEGDGAEPSATEA
jgi:hypothetical protein